MHSFCPFRLPYHNEKLQNERYKRLKGFVNANLIGTEGGARALQTPALIVELNTLHENLRKMQRLCNAKQYRLRPHVKTHKSVEIARLQIANGADGVCCAKLGEAEVMSLGGIENILVTSPIVTEKGIRRAISLSRMTCELTLVVDNHETATLTNGLAESAGVKLNVLLDVDPGMHRTGIEIGSVALQLAQDLSTRYESLVFKGIQFYAGNLMHVQNFGERRQKYLAATDRLEEFVEELASSGIQCEFVSGGGTGSYEIDFESRVMNELQAGSYAFMDRQYLEIESASGGALDFDPSLFVQSTVVSSNYPNMATTDTGLKAFATDDEVPLLVSGAPSGSIYGFMGDEHGSVRWRSDTGSLRVGDTVRTIVPHCDPTFNLYDSVHVIDGDRLVEIWKVDARGCSH